MTTLEAKSAFATGLMRGRIWGILLALAYVGILHAVYVQMIAPTYGYLGFEYRNPDVLNYVTVIVGVVVLGSLMPRTFDRPSVVVLWLHFLVATAPSMLVPQYTPVIDPADAISFGLGVGCMWLVVILLSSRLVAPTRTVSPRRGSAAGWTATVVAISIGLDLFLLALLGLRPQLATLTEISEVRLGYRDALAGAPAGTAYLLVGVSNVLNPILMVRGWLTRKLTVVGVGLFGQLVIYSVTGYKTVILSIPATLLIVLWLGTRRRADGQRLLQGVVGLMALAWGAFAILGNSFLAFLFILRFIVAPGNLAAAYVSIFENQPQLYWSQSVLSWAIEYPYAKSPNFLVGSLFRGSDITSANVNLFGDGYISMRWAGVLVECLVLVLVLWALDWASSGVELATSSVVVMIPTFALANSNIFTALTTHGFLLAILVLMSVPRSDAKGRPG